MAGSSSELIYRRGHDAQPAAGDVDGCGVMAAAGYSSSAKPPHKPPLGPLRYLLAEQRLVFALVGMAIASLVFLLAAPSSGNGGRHEVMNGGAARLAAAGLAIYHLACPASPVHYKHNPVKTIKTNVVGTLNMLGLAKRVGARFLLTSTSEVYGDPLQHPQVETYWGNVNPIGVRSCYDEGKRTAETLTMDYHRGANLEVRIARISTPTAPGTERIKSGPSGGLLIHPKSAKTLGLARRWVRSCYDEGKRTAETLTMDYHRGANLEVRIARIFNTYGPRMCIDDGRVVSNFVAQALRKEPLTVYGDGKQTRSFQYVSDLVEGLMKLMEGEHVGPFNLGNPGEFTMLELAKVVQDTIDPNARIEFRPNTADDPHKRKPDISRAKELLGWEPKIPLHKGLPLMVQDFRDRIFGDHKPHSVAGDN
ncbi:hypothetical protein OsJ_25550 [Oryza sativa Japonica Group]|uniref:UDP-glucuronate decarboxylase n=1 Tax=Oryza sativa subsp. japonica TaxID=39947 RepID=B9FUU7_ORYSJ|nr:hypothetical protein OsJ_25550 [Oryza sativa Japonica Group]